jgi:hypothetical protein
MRMPTAFLFMKHDRAWLAFKAEGLFSFIRRAPESLFTDWRILRRIEAERKQELLTPRAFETA